MIIACGVLSCVAVLLGIIILEIAIDKKRKAKKQASPDEMLAENPVQAEEQTSQTSQASPDEKQAEELAQASSVEKPAEEPVQTEEVIIAEEPVEVVVPQSEPIIEEAPAPIEELPHVEDIIAEEPAVVIEHTPAEAPAVEEVPVIEETPIIAIEQQTSQTSSVEQPAEEPVQAVEEEPVQTEEPQTSSVETSAQTVEGETVELQRVEDPAPEAVEEETPVEPEETEEDDSAELNGVEDPDDEVASELKVVVKDGQTRYIVIKYSKSFEAKLIQGTDDAKRYYSELKNCLLSYGVKSNHVKSRMSWKWEAFRYGRKTLARLRLRGKTISVVLALNPDDYKDTKYLVESVADIACYADTPALCRIKSERRLKYTKELIAKMMQDNGLTQKPDFVPVDYAPLYPYDTTENLVERKLIKVLTDEDAQSGEVFKPSDIRKSVKAQDVDNILQDEIAVELIEKLDGVSDRTKSSIINIDTLSQNFKDGETVTIEEIRKRIKGYNKVTYIKVLARGTLDKKLTVEADDFSLQAVKMIALLGGRVVKK